MSCACNMIDTEARICSPHRKRADSLSGKTVRMTKLGQAVQNLLKTALLSTAPGSCAQRRARFKTQHAAKPRILILLSKRFTT